MKKIKIILYIISTFILLTGCASGGANKPKNDNWKDFENSKKIVIGFDNTFVPMGFQDKSGANIGFDIDLANAVFAEYGINVEWQAINWDLKETELKNGNIDLIWNGYSRTKEREQNVLFTDDYMINEQVIVTKKTSGITKVSELKEKVLGAQNGSSGYDVFNAEPKVLKDFVKGNDATQYESFNEAIIDLENERIEALLIDRVYANYYLKQQNKLSEYNIFSAGFESESFSVGARKADKMLVEKINSAFKKLYQEKKFQDISKKWFGEDVVTKDIKNR
ncbi:ABC transporter, substrate-binding protein, family 3 [Gemella bergeri ATCC 700627]|uniref:ABC transporter, substrate-binding protein, family 3 n=1 Tax=Gemella bergeri ATCC 700627 TaxID=1321820 RepID=U2QLT3_9BACL|nr:amino acid ABC transporter substrate-binding protein [Gemella bergeri]ERK57179.1 ABC transporter, substrate-binding protein, family 3 [Gemella bergeri ATCC 700627]